MAAACFAAPLCSPEMGDCQPAPFGHTLLKYVRSNAKRGKHASDSYRDRLHKRYRPRHRPAICAGGRQYRAERLW
ncbi:hypothetical protein AGR13a_Cc280003 [Agrobacterium genomosp. 13 str. CFBP 6927]|uniref:Uncharacterized protein n=1 Tax=Agrobacterium genomosp. 13 str. CFBP 6927 TaxID=1183428 RepID=A0ABM9VFH3_9HYPH|nr:hypothetical protein AGR13a_Cc280003 [Agrobacterium genomosp. 13 str. CFBP 6927]